MSPVVVNQEVVVQYKPETSTYDIGHTYNNLGLHEVSFSPYSGLRRARLISNNSVYTVAASLNQNPSVKFAEPNYLRKTDFIPNDPLYKYQWHINNSSMQQTWDLSMGANVTVAVLDTGVAYRNGGGFARAPDLADTSFTTGYDFVNDDSYPDDDNRHGTHIAGIIAQSTNNLLGVAGVAPECILMPVKVLDNAGSGNVADIVEGIYYAVNNGAQVINMSYGFVTTPSSSEEEAINYAISQGVTIICSAGNEATNEPHYPSSYPATICVTASRYDSSFASSYSNYGSEADICAPGGDLDQDLNGDDYPDGIYQQTHNGIDFKKFEYYFAEGTSCASAFLSGVAALVMARASRPLTPAEVRDLLQTTAIDMGDPGWDQFYGWGLVNPLAAVKAAVAYTTAGYFVPAIPLQTGASNAIRYPYPSATTTINTYNTNAYTTNNRTSGSYNSLIARPVQYSTETTGYQSNAGFIPVTTPYPQSAQNRNIQAGVSSLPQAYNLYPVSTFSNFGLNAGAYPIFAYNFPQNFVQWPGQSTVNNTSYSNTSAGYQPEALFSSSVGYYQPTQVNNVVSSPFSFLQAQNPNPAFFGHLYSFWY